MMEAMMISNFPTCIKKQEIPPGLPDAERGTEERAENKTALDFPAAAAQHRFPPRSSNNEKIIRGNTAEVKRHRNIRTNAEKDEIFSKTETSDDRLLSDRLVSSRTDIPSHVIWRLGGCALPCDGLL